MKRHRPAAHQPAGWDEPEQLTIGEPVVLVADEVTATILAEIPREFLSGVVSLKGGPTPMPPSGPCHGVAAIMGWICPLGDIGGRTLVIDGYSGDLFIEPNQVILTEYRQLLSGGAGLDTLVRSVDSQPSETADGTKVSLLLNAGLSADTEISLNHLADGVGLYRTEIPSCCRTASLRVGADRPLSRDPGNLSGSPGLHADSGRGGTSNCLFPHRGGKSLPWLAGIRLTLDHPELFLVQLKAMLRASEGLDNLAIMLPMISSVSEIKASVVCWIRRGARCRKRQPAAMGGSATPASG